MRVYTIISILLLFLFEISNAQNKEKLISLSVSNNGLLAHKLDEFYYHSSWNAHPYDYNDFELKLKFDLAYDFQLKENLFLKGKLSFGTRHDTYDNGSYSDPGYAKGKINQNYSEIEIGLQRRFTEGKFQVLTGGSLLFNIVSDKTETNTYNDQSPYSKLTIITKGGTAFGISSITTLRYYLGEKFFLATNIRIAALFVDLGGKIQTKLTFVDNNAPPTNQKGTSPHFRNFEITRPDFSFGAGFRF